MVLSNRFSSAPGRNVSEIRGGVFCRRKATPVWVTSASVPMCGGGPGAVVHSDFVMKVIRLPLESAKDIHSERTRAIVPD